MQCLRCGSENPGTAYHCLACGAVLQSDAPATPGAVMPGALRQAWDNWRYLRPTTKVGTSLALGALAAYAMHTGLGWDNGFPLFLLGTFLAILGALAGLDALKGPGRRTNTLRGRAAAGGGVLLSGGVLLAPVAFSLGQVALIPRRMATEPMAINNVRHLAVALQAYLEDYDERLPGWMTGPDGRPFHNVWDEQLAPYVKDDDLFLDGSDGHGIRSPWTPPPRRRILSYALNGLLITHPKAAFDGNADWDSGPMLYAPSAISDPAGTIVFAEVATRRAMGGIYARPQVPKRTEIGGDAHVYIRALSQWIDIDPRAWVETSGPVKSYNRRTWDEDRGIGRALHSGGAACSFMDGHVEFVKLRRTVTGGQIGLPTEKYWSPDNTGNMWNPVR